MNDRPIGVFDSGIGGLTVLKALRHALPGEAFLYLGDTARVPYGTKSAETVRRYALQAAQALVEREVKAIVIACNTASAVAVDALRDAHDLPVLGVVEAGARAAVAATRNRRIGVIGTTSTIASGAYVRALGDLDEHLEIHGRACPLLVPLAEEGWETSEVAREVCRHYLEDLRLAEVDTLILGCTHYPVLEAPIRAAVGEQVRLVDSAEETARQVAMRLREDRLMRRLPPPRSIRFLVTDDHERFQTVGTRLLAEPIQHLERVDLEGRNG